MTTKTLSYRIGESVVHAIVPATMRLSVAGEQHVPATGPCIVVANHVSHADPLAVAQFLTKVGRVPRFLTKDAVFEVPVVGAVLTRAGQIPVIRESTDAINALAAADRALQRGECIVIYPEGTLTRDPAMWPMRGKLGAARLALHHRCPVIPVAQWGAQDLLPPYTRVPRLPGMRRPTVRLLVGPPVDLEPFRPAEGVPTVRDLVRATQAITRDITGLLAQLRDEPPPASVWNPKAHGQAPTGKPMAMTAAPHQSPVVPDEALGEAGEPERIDGPSGRRWPRLRAVVRRQR